MTPVSVHDRVINAWLIITSLLSILDIEPVTLRDEAADTNCQRDEQTQPFLQYRRSKQGEKFTPMGNLL